MPVKAIVFDRDGTLIEHVPYLFEPGKVRLLPGVQDGVKRLINKGVMLFIHSNQSGVGRGYFRMSDAEACNQRMLELLGGGDIFTEVCMAPEAPKQPAVYRKPEPRFARELMVKHGFKPSEICYVGDRGSDVETAHRAGTRAIGITTGLENLGAELQELGLLGKYPVVSSFTEAVDLILNDS
jgi:D-glycero-D-manno-heptose 1,7-bisphosphate phosphatase